jgi:hypothetical protein
MESSGQHLRLWLRFGWRHIIVWPTLVLSDCGGLYLLFSLFLIKAKEHKFWWWIIVSN